MLYFNLTYLKHTDKYVHVISCSKKQRMGWDPSIAAEDGEHEVIYFNPCDVGVKKKVQTRPDQGNNVPRRSSCLDSDMKFQI